MKSIKILTAVILTLSVMSVAYLFLTTRRTSPELQPIPEPITTAPAGPAPSQPTDEPLSPGEQFETLENAVRVFGTVIDAETNAPIAGASLTVKRSGRDGETFATTADETGAFSLSVSASEGDALLCTAKGYRPVRQRFSGSPGASVRLDFLLLQGSSVAGVVSDATTGAPIEGVRVLLLGAKENVFDLMQRGQRDSEGALIDTTGQNGTYRIEGVPPGSYRIVLEPRDTGYLVSPEDAITLDVAAAIEYDAVDFALERGGVITGAVTNMAGAPVEQVRIVVVPAQMIQSAIRGLNTLDPSAFGPRRSQTGDDGTFEVSGVEFNKDLRVVAQSNAYALARSDALTLTRGIPSARVDFTLTPGSTVSGTARYPDGSPASEIRLMLFPDSGEGWSDFMGPRSAATDSNGTFHIAHLTAGSYLLRPEREFGLQRPGRPGSTLPVVVDGRTDLAGVEFVIQREAEEVTGMITGVVVDPAGAPVPEVRVDARRMDNPRETAGAMTLPDGSFELTGLRGLAYDVSVDDEAGLARQSAVAAGEQITIQLAAPGVVGGLVVDGHGEAVQGARVQLKDLGDSGPAPTIESIMRGLFSGASEGETTDPYGRFEFRKVAPGDYEVAVETTAQGTARSDPFTISAGMELTNLYLVLDPGVSFSGIVVGPAGEPIRGAQVQLVPSGVDATTDTISQFLPAAMLNTAGSTTSTETGEFAMNHVPAGTYKLIAAHGSYAKTTVPKVQVYSGRDVAGYRIVMSKGGNARGTYLIDGKPQAGAMVMIVGASGFEMVQTDGQGMFDVRGLPTGTYMLNGFDPARIASNGQGIQFRPQIVDIVDGQVVNVDLGGSAGVPVTGVVSGATGALTVVALRKPGGPSLEDLDLTNVTNLIESMRFLAGQSVIGPDGTFNIDGVEPGDYVLEVYSLNFDQRNPDVMALMNMPRTPAYQQTISVGEEPPNLNIVLGP